MNWVPAALHAGRPRDLVRAFAVDICDRYRVAVNTDPCPHGSGDDRNYIAQVITTTRVVDADGLGAKTRQLARRSSASVKLEKIRASWAVQVKCAGQARRLRATMSASLPRDPLVDPDWDMMIDLFIATSTDERLHVKELILMSGANVASAMRRINRLQGRGATRGRSRSDRPPAELYRADLMTLVSELV
jgi:hypothetical protein